MRRWGGGSLLIFDASLILILYIKQCNQHPALSPEVSPSRPPLLSSPSPPAMARSCVECRRRAPTTRSLTCILRTSLTTAHHAIMTQRTRTARTAQPHATTTQPPRNHYATNTRNITGLTEVHNASVLHEHKLGWLEISDGGVVPRGAAAASFIDC